MAELKRHPSWCPESWTGGNRCPIAGHEGKHYCAKPKEHVHSGRVMEQIHECLCDEVK